MDASTHFRFELSIQLNRTGLYSLNGKTICQNFTMPREQLNKVFKNQYIFGTQYKRDLKQLDYLKQGFKEKVSEKIHSKIMDDSDRLDLIIERGNRFDEWLTKTEITIKELV
jgi:hypothetical protein